MSEIFWSHSLKLLPTVEYFRQTWFVLISFGLVVMCLCQLRVCRRIRNWTKPDWLVSEDPNLQNALLYSDGLAVRHHTGLDMCWCMRENTQGCLLAHAVFRHTNTGKLQASASTFDIFFQRLAHSCVVGFLAHSLVPTIFHLQCKYAQALMHFPSFSSHHSPPPPKAASYFYCVLHSESLI